MKPNHKIAYDSLTQVINQITTDNLDDNTLNSLRQMVELKAFEPILSVIGEKIIEIADYLKIQDEKKKKLKEQESAEKILDKGDPYKFWTISKVTGMAKKPVEKNEQLREEIEDLLNSPPFEYEIGQDIRHYFDHLKPTPLPKDPV